MNKLRVKDCLYWMSFGNPITDLSRQVTKIQSIESYLNDALLRFDQWTFKMVGGLKINLRFSFEKLHL